MAFRSLRSGRLPAVLTLPWRVLLYTAPVWIPLSLFAQIGLLGLRPARAEHERLERAAVEVEARHAASKARYERMQNELAAWQDEIFRERWKRAYLARARGK